MIADSAGSILNKPRRTRTPSRIECLDNSDGTSYCHYDHSLCFNGSNMIIIDNKRTGSTNASSVTKTDGWLYLNYGGYSEGLPQGSGMLAIYKPETYLTNNDVEIVDDFTAFVPFHYDGSNIYHFAASIMVGFHVRMHYLDRSTSIEDRHKKLVVDNCPAFDDVYLMMDREHVPDWGWNLVDLALSNCSRIVFTKELVQRYIETQAPICFRRAMVFGLSMNLFSGIWDSVVFRQLASEQHGVKYEMQVITICLRTRNRLLLNAVELQKAISIWSDKEVLVVNFDSMSVKDQVAVLSKTAVFIAVHGAALTNVMFLPAGSAVIEISPYKFNHIMYEKISLNAGLMHYRYTASFEETDYNSTEFLREFSKIIPHISNRKCNRLEPLCLLYARDVDVRVNVDRFRSYFEAAMDVVE